MRATLEWRMPGKLALQSGAHATERRRPTPSVVIAGLVPAIHLASAGDYRENPVATTTDKSRLRSSGEARSLLSRHFPLLAHAHIGNF